MAASKSKTAASNAEITIMEIKRGKIFFQVLGRTPFVMNSLSEHTGRILLLPPGKKNAAEKASTLKHDVLREYRDSMYLMPKSPRTALGIPAVMPKACLRNAALDLPGSTKAQIGRLTFVEGQMIEMYGVPTMGMAPVRMADIARTPDIRTRAFLREWACTVCISYVQPLLRQQAVVNLFAAAGIMQGMGDWRPEKGKGDYGQFELVAKNNKDFKRIVAEQGRKAQEEAIETPNYFDAETEKMYLWYCAEVKRRGFPDNAAATLHVPPTSPTNGGSVSAQQ